MFSVSVDDDLLTITFVSDDSFTLTVPSKVLYTTSAYPLIAAWVKAVMCDFDEESREKTIQLITDVLEVNGQASGAGDRTAF